MAQRDDVLIKTVLRLGTNLLPSNGSVNSVNSFKYGLNQVQHYFQGNYSFHSLLTLVKNAISTYYLYLYLFYISRIVCCIAHLTRRVTNRSRYSDRHTKERNYSHGESSPEHGHTIQHSITCHYILIKRTYASTDVYV